MAQPRVLGKLLGANMNITTDQAIPLGYGHAIVTDIVVTNPSVSLTLAAGGLYTGAGKTGTIIVAATQLYAALTAAGLALKAVIAAPVRVTTAQIFFALTTAQGVAATADIYVLGIEADQ